VARRFLSFNALFASVLASRSEVCSGSTHDSLSHRLQTDPPSDRQSPSPAAAHQISMRHWCADQHGSGQGSSSEAGSHTVVGSGDHHRLAGRAALLGGSAGLDLGTARITSGQRSMHRFTAPISDKRAPAAEPRSVGLTRRMWRPSWCLEGVWGASGPFRGSRNKISWIKGTHLYCAVKCMRLAGPWALCTCTRAGTQPPLTAGPVPPYRRHRCHANLVTGWQQCGGYDTMQAHDTQ
jgi:hypothetical protein